MAALLSCPPSGSTTASFCFRRPCSSPLQALSSVRLLPCFPCPSLRFSSARWTPLLAASSNRPQATQQQQEEEEEEEIGEGVVPAPPPTPGRIDIVVTKAVISRLDLSPAHDVLRNYVHRIGDNSSTPAEDPHELLERTVGFVLEYENDDPLDPRELSELPDIRLWFVRLDAAYPWLPIVVDWRAGELSRYAAMLVPHQMSKRLGLVYNPEALELFAMNKLFLIHEWLKARNVVKPHVKLNNMMRMLGFSISSELYDLIDENPHP